MPITTKLHINDKKYIITNTGVRFLFGSVQHIQELEDFLKENLIKAVPLNSANRINSELGGINLLDFLEKIPSPNVESFPNISEEDTCVVIHTSGTTSKPKGVVHSYRTMLSNGMTFSESVPIEKGLRFYGILSLAYLGGFYNLLLIPILNEGSVVIENVFDPLVAINFWNTVKKHQVTALWMVPSILSILLSIDRSKNGKEYAENIRLALVGTAPLPLALKRRFEERYSLELYENYGLSETLFISTNSKQSSYNRGVGKVLPDCKVTLDNDGEIIVNTPFLMKGYLHDNISDHQLENAEFRTGDIGYFNDQGFLFITDRKKDLIVRGGINISPREIEEVIKKDDLVEEVAVLGVPHEFLGEEIVAVIKRKNAAITENRIKDKCKQELASFKIPNRIIFMESLPKSVTGKIQKNKIKEEIRQI